MGKGASAYLGFSLSHASVVDLVSSKMFEELKNRMDVLAQEVALLKEKQALQTGKCRIAVWRNTHLRRGNRQPEEEGCFHPVPSSRALTCFLREGCLTYICKTHPVRHSWVGHS
jgi:hypothetical protein